MQDCFLVGVFFQTTSGVYHAGLPFGRGFCSPCIRRCCVCPEPQRSEISCWQYKYHSTLATIRGGAEPQPCAEYCTCYADRSLAARLACFPVYVASSQIPVAIDARGVFYKQSMAGFFPTSCEVVADTLVNTCLTVSIPTWFTAWTLNPYDRPGVFDT